MDLEQVYDEIDFIVYIMDECVRMVDAKRLTKAEAYDRLQEARDKLHDLLDTMS